MVRNVRTLTPKESAEAVGCSADTIRRYCTLYSRHLSEGATPPKGRPRVLTLVDVELLKIAKRQTELGEPVEAVDTFLESVALDLPEETFEIEPVDDQVGEEIPEGLALMRQMVNSLDRLANQEDRLQRIEEALDRLREVTPVPPPVLEKPVKTEDRFLGMPPTIFAFVLGVVVVVALVAVVALVVWLLP